MTTAFVPQEQLVKYAATFFGGDEVKMGDKVDVFKALLDDYLDTIENKDNSNSAELFNKMAHDSQLFKGLSDDDTYTNDNRVVYRAIYTIVTISTMFYMAQTLKRINKKGLEDVPEQLLGRIGGIVGEFREFLNLMYGDDSGGDSDRSIKSATVDLESISLDERRGGHSDDK